MTRASLRELMFSSAASARQMNRGAREPALLAKGAGAGREALVFTGNKK